MKGVVRSLLLFFCTTLFMLSASVCVCVVRVHADTNTYVVFDDTCQTGVFYVNDRPYEYQNGVNTTEIRVAGFKLTNAYTFYAVSLNPFTCRGSASDTCTYGVFRDATSFTDVTTGTTFYARQIGSYAVAGLGSIPITDLTSFGYNAGTPTGKYVYTYTFGSGAVDPVEPVNWGLVDVKGYQTNVAGQGQASINNVDVISWDNAIDTNGNDITSGNVRIRFLPGEYKAETKNSLIQKTYNDFILDVVHATDGNVFPVTDGSASFRWSDVIHTLNLPFLSIYSLINENDAWIKRGWIYEIRLEIDDFVGEWQPIYASTSSGVKNDMTIVNTTVISQDTITAIQNINNLNNTTNIWIINGQPVDPNPEQTPPESDDEKPWWVYLLEMINNTLGIQNQYINEGTDESQDVVNSFEGDHNDLNVTVNDYDDIENTVVNDMNDNIDNLAIESDLIKNNSFINSARWVAEQYTTLTTNNPIGSILKFSLVLGFVMIFLGRFR